MATPVFFIQFNPMFFLSSLVPTVELCYNASIFGTWILIYLVPRAGGFH